MGDIIDFKTGKPKPRPSEEIAKKIYETITLSIDDGPRFTFNEDELVALGLPDFESFTKSMGDERLNSLHDACFDIQILAEESPEIADYATRKLIDLHKTLEIYKNNLNNG